MRDSYDIVVIGGGHNGLIAAIKLARSGYSVCLVEGRERVGGCAITTEPMIPGYRHSPHANCFLFADLLPQGITPSELGVSLIRPEAQFGVAFADGRPPVILHRPDLSAATRASLAVYSRADASKYVEMKRRSAQLGSLLRQGIYTAPDSRWFEEQRRAVLQAYGPFCSDADLGRRTARQLVDQIFEVPEIRVLLYALAIETGVGLEVPGGDLAFLGFSLWVAGRWRVPAGGMGNYTGALLQAAQGAGAQVYVSKPVERIFLSEGRASGIRTIDGTDIGAAVAVLAATPLLTVFEDLLSAKHISPAMHVALEEFRKASTLSIGTTAFCLDWRPRYKSGVHDPQIDRCLKTVIGFDTPSDVIDHAASIQAGQLPYPAGVVRVHSLWDPTLAPQGHHIAAIDSAFPDMKRIDTATWALVEGAFPTAMYDAWQNHLIDRHSAPAMSMSLDSALGFERRMLVSLGSAQYRTSVDGLYLAGPGVYPGGGVHGACGHNAAATVIADQNRHHARR